MEKCCKHPHHQVQYSPLPEMHPQATECHMPHRITVLPST